MRKAAPRSEATLSGFLVGTLLLLLPGCSLVPWYSPGGRTKSPPASQAPTERFGTVLRVDGTRGFVVIQKDPFVPLPEPGETVLHCNDPLAPGARLRLSVESRRNLVVADILDGRPNRGDTVYLAPLQTPQPASPAETPAPPRPQEED